MTKAILLPVCFGLFTSTVVMTNAVSANVIQVGPFIFVAGTLLYPATFLLTDVISETWGKRMAQRAVWTGFAAQLLAIAFVQLAALFPSLDPAMGEAWRAVFLPTMRIAFASMCAYLVAQTIDVYVFHRIRDATEGRHLWLRNNVATIVSQGFDTVIFVAIAFFGVMPLDVLAWMALGQYAAKTILAALDTPLAYLAVGYAARLPE